MISPTIDITQYTFMCSLQFTHVCMYDKFQWHNHYIATYLYILDPPVIDEGSFIPRPSNITRGNKRVKIGTSVYVYGEFDVIIDCNIINGTPPITITWFRNGSPYPANGNTSNTITITDGNDGDVFKCRADNIVGFDMESTTVYVECGKYIIHTYLQASIHTHTYVHILLTYICTMYMAFMYINFEIYLHMYILST